MNGDARCSPEHEFPAPWLAMSSEKRCCTNSTSLLTFPQPPQPLPCSGSRHAERKWPFGSATSPLKTFNARPSLPAEAASKTASGTPTRQSLSARKVNAALIAVSKFEVMGLQVRSDETTAAAATSSKRRREAALASELSNDHAGGRQSVLEACEGIGVDLGAVIEELASRLSKHHNGSSNGDGSADSGDGGGAGTRRDSEKTYRKCTWEALADEVCSINYSSPI